SENTSQLYVTVGGGGREFKVLSIDGDGTEVGMTAIWHKPTDFTGTEIKVRWKIIITDAGVPDGTETIYFDVFGVCVETNDDLDGATMGTQTAVDYADTGTEARDDIIISAWTTLGTTTITDLNTANHDTCLIAIIPDDDPADSYPGAAERIGFLGLEIKHQRAVEAF
ncbi:MAG: hypothetical protein ACXABY_32150, partial [Candidatus Thorarchaeota archaeon]